MTSLAEELFIVDKLAFYSAVSPSTLALEEQY
jgi:hypothetical protein